MRERGASRTMPRARSQISLANAILSASRPMPRAPRARLATLTRASCDSSSSSCSFPHSPLGKV